jgi:hypothetical protein
MMRKVVIVSPFFPPSFLAGVHRARHLAKHLPAFGWHPIVLCVDEAFHEQGLDPALVDLLPSEVEVVKVQALPARASRLFGIGDLSLRAFFELRRALYQLLQSGSIRGVLITGGPYYTMLLTSEIERKFGVPSVLDFQDPWVSRWGGGQPLLTKVGLAHALARRLEPRALRFSSFITSVSERQNIEMLMRYPWLDPMRMAAIPIGGDPDDFELLRRSGVALPPHALDPSRINLSFVGTIMPRSGPLVKLVLQGLYRLKQIEPEVGARIRLNFIGTSNQPGDNETYSVLPTAKRMGMTDSVQEIPQRLPFLQAIAILSRSDGLLLIGSDEAHYTASKIYPALMSGRPFLSVFHRESSSHAILCAAGGGRAHAYEPDVSQETLIDDIAASLRTIASDPASLGRTNPAAYSPYEAKMIASRFSAILDDVSGNNQQLVVSRSPR